MVTDLTSNQRHQDHQFKRVAVSSKRQISIPKEFYQDLNIQEEIIMEKVGNRLIIRPSDYDNYVDFTEEILQDLIEEGYPKECLVEKLKERKTNMYPALKRLITDKENEESVSLDELFSEE